MLFVVLSVVDENDKTILIGPVQLPNDKKPQEKTLRKLYLYADGNEHDIAKLIRQLKCHNMTVAWTNDFNKTSKSVMSILNLAS